MTTTLSNLDQASTARASTDATDGDALARLHAERRDFECKVRSEIIAQHNRPAGWCADGTNRVLDDLGLPRLKHQYTGEVTVTVTVTVQNADDMDTAESWVASALSVDSNDSDVAVNDMYISVGGRLERENEE